ncbi:MAG: histidine phosphatase family protein [Planctomycetes bacterium]|nr:histidine phosphatase family protein [Planctomycetota bacterium]MCB9888529.1 histidine phosphatase family protein [Planctomycetota bacterium]
MLPETTDFCRLLLLRNPELEPRFSSIAVGGGEATLGRRGQAQVHGWLNLLGPVPVAAVHCPDQPQCEAPARALGVAKQLDVVVDPRLRDQNMGSWQGRNWDEVVQQEGASVHEFFANFGEVPAPGGESLGQAVERVLSWWQDIAPQGLGKSIAVISSGALLSGFAAAMLGLRLSRSVSLGLPYGGLGVLDCFGNGVRIACWNPTALSELA